MVSGSRLNGAGSTAIGSPPLGCSDWSCCCCCACWRSLAARCLVTRMLAGLATGATPPLPELCWQQSTEEGTRARKAER